ncbi:MAG TPA: 6-pyruvoyl-tetrahydropterin synthase-related protein, partial [Chloroflexota bacterium]|nr:6-pyruvoyl-tetrahydropterin synthase-related protein [Chloroflexota bacterium]
MAATSQPGRRLIPATAWPRPRLLATRAFTRGSTLWWAAGLALALLVTLPAWLPWLDPRLDFRVMDDARNHLMRLYHLDFLVRRGVWYPRWLPDLFLGYGYPVFNYYAPGFYYLTLALRTLLRLDLWDAFRAAGVVATVLGAAGSYALIVTLWRRVAPAVLGAALVLYAPYAFQTNLFKRADLPEILGLALLPFLLLTIWRSWTAPSAAAGWRWAALATLFGAAILLLHNLAALLAAAVATVWVLFLLLAVPAGAGRGPRGRAAALARIAAAGLLAAGLTAFFWFPAAGEGGAVQLEWLHDGDLRYDNWLLDLSGDTPRQQSAYNRQTRAGPIDLHLRYPHQLVASPKLSLAQGVVAVAALLGLAAGSWPRHRPPPAPDGEPRPAPVAPVSAVLPFWLVALVCWGMTFTLSAPVWAAVPGLPLLQFPWRLLGPLAVCLAVAVAGSFVPLLRRLEAGDAATAPGASGAPGRRAGWLLLGVLTLGIALNGATDRAIPYDDLDGAARAVDGTNVVLDERRDPKTVGTTSGREFLPRQVDVPLFSRGAFRYRDVLERLYPEADWLGGRLLALSGDVRFLGWRAEPLRLTALVANDGAAPARVGIRQLDFPGWRAWLDGQPAPVEQAPYVPEQQVSPGFIVLSVPPGEHAIAVAFGPSPRRAAGLAITLGSVVAVATATVRFARRRPGGARP